MTGSLEHPGVVPVYALGHFPDGRPYYAMRFIRGESFKEAISRFHRTPWSQQPRVSESWSSASCSGISSTCATPFTTLTAAAFCTAT